MITYKVEVPENQKVLFEKTLQQLGLTPNEELSSESQMLFLETHQMLEKRLTTDRSKFKDARQSLQQIRSGYDL